jgi:hypothetical protein
MSSRARKARKSARFAAPRTARFERARQTARSPQHIGCRCDGPNPSVAWIDGTVWVDTGRDDLRYREVACAGH